MDDASNWEFAASIAAVCIGLSGLLLFTLIGTIGGWRVLDKASRAAEETAKSSVVMQDLARQLAMREASQPVVDVAQAASQLAGLRVQAEGLHPAADAAAAGGAQPGRSGRPTRRGLFDRT